MINPFYNDEEKRPRAAVRLLGFLILSFLILFIPSLIPITWVDYTLKALFLVGFYRFNLIFTDRRNWQEGGLIINNIWLKEFGIGTLAALSAMLMIFLIQLLSGGLRVAGFGWEADLNVVWFVPILIILVQMLSVGIYEEVMLRGYVLRNLHEGLQFQKINNKYALWAAVLLSSVLFGLLHVLNPNATVQAVVNIVAAGVMLALPFLWTGRLALSAGIHFSWNFFMSAIFGFNVSGLNVRNSLIRIEQQGPDFWTGSFWTGGRTDQSACDGTYSSDMLSVSVQK